MSDTQTIVLAGGCFWCTESVFKEVRGVLDVESGYSNGQETAPTYEQVCTGRTGCNEVVKLVYDPAVIGTRQILEIFFATHDPTQLNRQGNDVGTQYRSGIYFTTPEQQQVAQDLIREINQGDTAAATHYAIHSCSRLSDKRRGPVYLRITESSTQTDQAFAHLPNVLRNLATLGAATARQ